MILLFLNSSTCKLPQIGVKLIYLSFRGFKREKKAKTKIMSQLIIGGGPIGLFLGSKIKNSTIIEQKPKIGTPTRCTGIVTKEIEEFMSKKDLHSISKNKITETEIIGPKKKLKLQIGTNYIISNQQFEEYWLDKALKNNCSIETSSTYSQSLKKGHVIRNNKTKKEKTIKTTHLVGCDGPLSKVSTIHGLDKHRHNYMGHQVTIKVKEHENNIKFFPHIGQYAWYVPETETTARVGVCTNIKGGKAIFDAFLKRFKGKQLSNQSGLIPTFSPRRKTHIHVPTHSVTLLGDAAGHIKNTTGGGIIPGFKAANHFSKTMNTYSESKALRKELYTHFLVHNLVSSCSHKEWDDIIEATKKHRDVLEHTNRDNLRKVAKKVLFDKTYLAIGLKKLLSGKITIR